MSNPRLALILDGSEEFDAPLFRVAQDITIFRKPPPHPSNYDLIGSVHSKMLPLNPGWLHCAIYALTLPGINFVQPFQRVHYVDKAGTLTHTCLGLVHASILESQETNENLVLDNWIMRSQFYRVHPEAKHGWTSVPGDMVCMI